ncbi:MAG TPA: hypothetical protein PKA03_07905 [Tabrizicola sp.]|nr:hypothetical protein [Tabrizicola sp.]
MTFLRPVAIVIGLSQIVLAALSLAVPAGFVTWQGLTPPAADAGYPLAMLAARFLVYGIGMFHIARGPEGNLFWARGMVAIQAIDFAAGATFLAMGVITPATALLPMINSAIFALALSLALRHAGLSGPAQAQTQ